MAEIVGRFTCPICGEQSQDLKKNKNGKLYCYCDCGCKSQLNSKDSRAVSAALAAGKSVKLAKIGVITPVSAPVGVITPLSAPAARDELENDLDI